MLVLTRRPGEKVIIRNNITITVLEVTGNKIRVGIDAPEQVRILRAELAGRPGEPLDAPVDGRLR
jgi:carbon storage regulator